MTSYSGTIYDRHGPHYHDRAKPWGLLVLMEIVQQLRPQVPSHRQIAVLIAEGLNIR